MLFINVHTQPRDQNGTDLPVKQLHQIIKFILVITNYPNNN